MGPGPAGQDGLSPGGESVGSCGNGNGIAANISNINNIPNKREVETESTTLSDGGGAGAGSAVGMAMDGEVLTKKRKTATGSRGVANLTPEQLAKKRANDREAQRAIRERTKNQIEGLERRIQELTNLNPYRELQAVIRAKEAVEFENVDIKRRLASIIGMLQPLVGSNPEQPYLTPAQPYTPSATAQTVNNVNYHASTPTNSASPAGGLDQQHGSQPPQPGWHSAGHSTPTSQLQSNPASGIDEHTRAQLEQQRQSLRHGLEMGQERLDLDFVLAPGQASRVPRLQRGIHGAQDSGQYRHVPMKHDWTPINQDYAPHVRTSSGWEPPAHMGMSVSIPSHQSHDSVASSPEYARRDTPSHHQYGPSPSPGLSGLPAMSRYPDEVVGPNDLRRYAAGVKNCDSTCPLDLLLINFLRERRQRAADGLPPQEIAGPRYPSVSSLLNPANSVYSHPLSKFFTDILATFPDISRLPEKVAVLYVMFLVMRWQISPTRENYMRVPEWIQPLDCQLTEEHPAWIDHLPFPHMREFLTRNEKHKEYPFDNFFIPFTTTLCLCWPYDDTDTLLQDPDSNELMINPVFERHLRNLDNWKLGDAFQRAFPDLAPLCNIYKIHPTNCSAPADSSHRRDSTRSGV